MPIAAALTSPVRISSDSPWFWLALCAAGTLLGLLIFYRGFQMLRYKRLILNTPTSRIHSASIGLVEVTGTAVGPHLLTAPVTSGPCFYYRVQAWQWEKRASEKNYSWHRVLDESAALPFFLEDGTGRVLLDSTGAEMDVHRSFWDEIESSYLCTKNLVPLNIRKFLALRGLVPLEKIKIEELVIQPGFPLFVFGTLGDTPATLSWNPQPHVSAGRGAPSLFNFQFNVGPGLNFTLQNRTPAVQPKPLDLSPPNTVSHAVASVQHQTAAAVLDPPGAASVPEFDLHPPVAISKGQRGDPFTISWHSEKELVQSLAWKSALCIWGGPVLAILSFYVFLLVWGYVFS